MISRKTSRFIAEAYERVFRRYPRRGARTGYYIVANHKIYEFLYDNSYPAWFCNVALHLQSTFSTGTRPLKQLVMRLHTGETIVQATPEWTWEQREKLGQKHLRDLAEDMLNYLNQTRNDQSYKSGKLDQVLEPLKRGLELDGYTFKGGKLLVPEEDALDVQGEIGVLESLYAKLELGDIETAVHHLRLTEEHYLKEKWDDSIGNSRKFLECVLREVAKAHSTRCKETALTEADRTRPVKVREYLEREGLLETKEREALDKVYALLSATGGHPYMAANDQARLLRHLALTFAQFVMLRLRGELGGLSDG